MTAPCVPHPLSGWCYVHDHDPLSRGTTTEPAPVQQHTGECYAQGAPCDCRTDASAPSHVWVCETGDYEQRYVEGVYASPEDAAACIKAEHLPPYRVTWDDMEVGGDLASLVGHFEAVVGKSTQHTAQYDLTRMPVATAPAQTTPEEEQ